MSEAFTATRFDGRSAQGKQVEIRIDDAMLVVLANDSIQRVSLNHIAVSERFEHAPRMLGLPDGVTLEVPDPQLRFAEALVSADVRESAVVRMQRAWPLVTLALLALVAAVALAYWKGLPIAAEAIVKVLPVSFERKLGDGALAALDRSRLRPSKLAAEQRARIAARFKESAAIVAPGVDTRLEFRSGMVNAFALPGGTIVLFDELVELAKSDDAVLGVLGHELGHVANHHSMRQLVQALGIGAIVTLLWGDVSSVAANVPLVLGLMRYGRAFEEEADAFATDFLVRNQTSVKPLLDFFVSLEEHDEGRMRKNLPEFLSSHPGTEARMLRLRRAIESEGATKR
ncbi:MAG TPA: M48 family metallopeptidase [Casimicrobiaceae bacterium]|nr:M48 family metallopeptidase [Casimicrobiaceae bacterium]